jgi:hypothetical protein
VRALAVTDDATLYGAAPGDRADWNAATSDKADFAEGATELA